MLSKVFKRVPYARILVLDHAARDLRLQASTTDHPDTTPRMINYWWARLPLPELIRVNPAGLGTYRRSAWRERLLTFGFLLGSLFLTGFSIGFLFLSDPNPNYTLANSLGLGVFLALLIGCPIALLISKFFLPLRIMAVLGRINGVPFWAVPMPAMGSDEDSTELVEESIANMWTREELLLGADGWATRNFLEAIGAAKETQALRWGARQNGNVIGLDRRPPNEQGQQGG